MSEQLPARPPRTFREVCLHAANPILAEILDPERAREAAGRVAMALGLAARVAPKLELCTPQSVGAAIAYCAAAELMPGGPRPAVYLIPRARKEKRTVEEAGRDGSVRRVERWVEIQEIHTQVSTAGYQQLAARAGYALSAIAVYVGDETRAPGGAWEPAIDGEMIAIDINAPRSPSVRRPLNASHNVEDFVGVVVVVRRLDTGAEVGWTFVDRHQVAERRACSDSWDKAQKALDSKSEMEDWQRKAALKTPWIEWPEEMALKTGVRYGVARGIVPLDDVGMRVFEADGKADAIDTTAEVMPRPEPRRITSTAGAVIDELLGDEMSEADKQAARDAERAQS